MLVEIRMISLVLAIGSLGFFTLLLVNEFFPRLRTETGAKVAVGDGIVYRKQKVSAHPSARAYDIHPAGQGETYSYCVDKFWVVKDVLRDGRIVVLTRTQKEHYLEPHDPNLRKAGLMARLRYRNRFPHLLEAA